jgi:DNA-binding response OmpR family regulator
MENPGAVAFVLIAVVRDRSLASLLDAQGYAVIESPTGAHALKWARTVRPDLIILDDVLPDFSGTAVCRLLRSDPDLGQNVPILILNQGTPTPEQRVAALSAGAWDFLEYPSGEDLALKLDAYILAKQSVDVALSDSSIIPATSLHGRGGLARRARELGALMVRCRAPLSAVVFQLGDEHVDPRLAAVVAHAARVSDVVGVLNPNTFAVVAPATGDKGAVMLARRVVSALTAVLGRRSRSLELRLEAGYDAINTFAYSPIDPALLLARAEAAVRIGRPEPGLPWLRRHATGEVDRVLATSAQPERSVSS